MAWSVNDIMNLFCFLTNKNQSSAISANRFFYAWNTEQNMYHADLVGRWENRNNTKTGLNTGLVKNEITLTTLSPFTISKTVTPASGIITKPSDFIYTFDLRIGDDKIVHITPDQISAVNKSVIDPPSITDGTYYYTEYEGYYYLLPQDTSAQATLDYIAAPTNIKWGYTNDADGREIYDSATSVQPKWKQDTIITITKRALVNFGVSFKDNDFLTFGRTAQMSGD